MTSLDGKSLTIIFGYKDDRKVKPLCIMLPKMRGYTKSFNKLNICLF